MKQFLTLMLAFVMVFTGMGIGSWGMDTAWADDSIPITVTANGISQTITKIGTANFVENDKPFSLYLVTVPYGTTEINAVYENHFIPETCFGGTVEDTKVYLNHAVDDEELVATITGMSEDRLISIDKADLIAHSDVKSDFVYFSNEDFEGAPLDILLVQVRTVKDSSEGLTDEQKKPLTDLLATVTGENEQKWYKKNDRYNGKTYNENGFWNEFTAQNGPREIAQLKLDVATTDAMISSAVTELQSAIANLIPKTQLNATKLYEAVQERGNYSEEFLEDCTDVSAAAYRKIAEKAKAYLKLLFDEEKSEEYPEGAMKTVNVPENQGVADDYAEELKNFRFLFKEEVSNATWNLKTINALAKQYNMTENNGKYTEESWKTFVAAREAAVDYAKKHPISNSMKSAEVKEYAKLARAFQSAAYGLTSKKETVTVTFSYTDDYHLRWVDIKEPLKSWTSDPKTSKVQKQTLELISGTTLEELWNQTGCTPGTSYFAPNSYSTWRTLVNGRMLNGYTPGVQQYFADANYVLKDGDEIQLVHMDWPTFVFNYIYRDDVKWDKMADILGILRFAESEEGSQNAAAGEDINLTLERTSAHLGAIQAHTAHMKAQPLQYTAR